MALPQHTTQLKLTTETLYGWLFAVQRKAGALSISEVLDNKDYQFGAKKHCTTSALTKAMVNSMAPNLISTTITPGSVIHPALFIQLVQKEIIKDNKATHVHLEFFFKTMQLDIVSTIADFSDKHKKIRKK